MGFPGGTSVNEPAFPCRRHKRHGFDPGSGRSKGMVTYSSILAWRIPMDRGEPGGLESICSHGIGHG